MKLTIVADTRNLACPTCSEHVNQTHAITQCSNCEHVSHADCYAEMGCGAWECTLGVPESDWLTLAMGGDRHDMPREDVERVLGEMEQ